MKCPHCQATMIDKSYGESCFHTGPEPDYDFTIPVDYYICPRCLIKYKKKMWDDVEWIVPSKIALPTDRQIRTMKMINHFMNMDLPIVTKQQCIRDINEYLKETIQRKEYYLEQVAEWYTEEYGQFEYY